MQYSCNPFIYKVVKDLVLRHLHSMYAAEYVILFLILTSEQERMCMPSSLYPCLPVISFLLKILNHGLFGRMKIIASRPNLEPASKEQL